MQQRLNEAFNWKQAPWTLQCKGMITEKFQATYPPWFWRKQPLDFLNNGLVTTLSLCLPLPKHRMVRKDNLTSMQSLLHRHHITTHNTVACKTWQPACHCKVYIRWRYRWIRWNLLTWLNVDKANDHCQNNKGISEHNTCVSHEIQCFDNCSWQRPPDWNILHCISNLCCVFCSEMPLLYIHDVAISLYQFITHLSAPVTVELLQSGLDLLHVKSSCRVYVSTHIIVLLHTHAQPPALVKPRTCSIPSIHGAQWIVSRFDHGVLCQLHWFVTDKDIHGRDILLLFIVAT